jgi:hypothetical protein
MSGREAALRVSYRDMLFLLLKRECRKDIVRAVEEQGSQGLTLTLSVHFGLLTDAASSQSAELRGLPWKRLLSRRRCRSRDRHRLGFGGVVQSSHSRLPDTDSANLGAAPAAEAKTKVNHYKRTTCKAATTTRTLENNSQRMLR